MQLKLDTLNLCKNALRRIEGLSHLKHLQTLLLSHNQLSSVEDCSHLRECASVSCLDIQENRIEDPAILDVLEQMPSLAVLYLQVCPQRMRRVVPPVLHPPTCYVSL